MSNHTKVWEGDSWKHADKGIPAAERLTRPELQAELNANFALGVIGRDEWRAKTDHLSSCDFRGNAYASGKGQA